MSAERLLMWMSARRAGSWSQFRAAVEELHFDGADNEGAADLEESNFAKRGLPLYQSLRLNLQRLGHAEFFSGAGGTDWRISPPCLAVTRSKQSWVGILVGARTSRLLNRLADAAKPTQLELEDFPACPSQIRIFSQDVQQLREVAERSGILFQEQAPAAILSCLPRIDERAILRAAQPPFGPQWRTERFSAYSLHWEDASIHDASRARFGLFRFTHQYERTVLLFTQGRAYEVPIQIGKYIALKARRNWVIQYESNLQQLSVPASCRPPILIERALILCSGTPPRFEVSKGRSGYLHYAEVPAPIARLTSALLCQELQ